MELNLILDLCIPVVIALLASGICWLFSHKIFSPSLEVSDLKYNKRSRPYVNIVNTSKSQEAYEIVCNVSYYDNGNMVYTRLDNMKPMLEVCQKERNKYQLKLDGSEKTNELFSKEGHFKIDIVVSYQNRYGVKKNIVKTLIVREDGDNN